MFLTLNIDEDEYPVPADGRVEQELQEAVQEYIYDIDGVTIRTIRTVSE
jgi:hypothetical protein